MKTSRVLNLHYLQQKHKIISNLTKQHYFMYPHYYSNKLQTEASPIIHRNMRKTQNYLPHIEILFLFGFKEDALIAVFHFTHLGKIYQISYLQCSEDIFKSFLCFHIHFQYFSSSQNKSSEAHYLSHFNKLHLLTPKSSFKHLFC